MQNSSKVYWELLTRALFLKKKKIVLFPSTAELRNFSKNSTHPRPTTLLKRDSSTGVSL